MDATGAILASDGEPAVVVFSERQPCQWCKRKNEWEERRRNHHSHVECDR